MVLIIAAVSLLVQDYVSKPALLLVRPALIGHVLAREIVLGVPAVMIAVLMVVQIVLEHVVLDAARSVFPALENVKMHVTLHVDMAAAGCVLTAMVLALLVVQMAVRVVVSIIASRVVEAV